MIINNAGDYAWQCPNCCELNSLHDGAGEWALERCVKCQELFVMKNPKHKEDDNQNER